MNRPIAPSIHLLFALLLLVQAGLGGCRENAPDYSSILSPAPPLRDPETLVKYLPDGTTFKSPIISDRILGQHTRTVEEALGRLQVIARDGALYDGIGREIKFLRKAKDKDFDRTLAKLRAKYCVVLIAE